MVVMVVVVMVVVMVMVVMVVVVMGRIKVSVLLVRRELASHVP